MKLLTRVSTSSAHANDNYHFKQTTLPWIRENLSIGRFDANSDRLDLCWQWIGDGRHTVGKSSLLHAP